MRLEKRPEAGLTGQCGAWSGLLRSAFICKHQGPPEAADSILQGIWPPLQLLVLFNLESL